MSLQEKIEQKLATHASVQKGYRNDIYIADHKAITANASKVLICFEPSFGNITKADFDGFMASSFEGCAFAPDSVKVPKAGVVTAIVYRKTDTRAFADSANMRSLGGIMYIDQAMNETWEVANTDAGKVLSKVYRDDISALISKRRERMVVKARAEDFSTITAVTYELIDKGAEIRFFDGTETFNGTVTKVSVDGYSVKDDSGVTHNIAREAVIDLINVSKSKAASLQSDMADFYSKTYGPGHGDALVRELIDLK